jgi:hypothetical protein
MATSPIYSWPEPDNTDLVKNGALAIRTMGNAIDTTMGTMTPKSTFTAKGSIAAATAASTPANLSVGSNTSILMADSTAATGIKWDDGTYTSWTPASTPNLTLGNGTISGRYRQIGKTVFFNLSLVFGTTTSLTGNLGIQLPVGVTSNTANNGSLIGLAYITDTGVNAYVGNVYQNATNAIQITVGYVLAQTYTSPYFVNATIPHTWGSTDTLLITGTYDRP